MQTTSNSFEERRATNTSVCDKNKFACPKEELSASDEKGYVSEILETANVYNEAGRVSYTEEEGRKTKRKIDLCLLPLLCGCYMFSVRSLNMSYYEPQANPNNSSLTKPCSIIVLFSD